MKDKYWKMQGVGDAGTVLQLWKNQMDHFNGSQNKIQEEEEKNCQTYIWNAVF